MSDGPIELAGKPDDAAGGAQRVADAGVWFGVVIRPPGAAWDGVRYTGPQLVSVDDSALAQGDGDVRWVRCANFVGVAAKERAAALDAAARLKIRWAKPEVGLDASAEAGANPGREAVETSSTLPAVDARDAAFQPNATPRSDSQPFERRYRWPAYRTGMHADVPAIAVAQWHKTGVDLSVNCDRAAALRAEVAKWFALPVDAVVVVGNGLPAAAAAYDVAIDATLLAQALGLPVRVEEARPEDADPHRRMTVDAALDIGANGRVAGYGTQADALPWQRPPVGSLLADANARTLAPAAARTDARTYAFTQTHTGMAGDVPLDASISRDAPIAAHVFARESLLDEAARALGVDPLEWRLEHVDDASGAHLIRDVGARAGWQSPRGAGEGQGVGRGFACASAIDDSVDPPVKSWSAWVADVRVDAQTGNVDVTRLVVGHSVGGLTEPEGPARGLQDQIEGAVQRLLNAPESFDTWRDADETVQLTVPPAELVAGAAQTDVPAVSAPSALSAGAALTLPAAAAVANAIYDATGIRLREPPFGGPQLQRVLQQQTRRASRIGRACAWIAGVAAATAGFALTSMPWRAPIAPIERPDLSLYSAAALERGRLIAAAGDCAVCHTAPGGVTNAGGLALDTPFGTIYTTNLTPDVETGIGGWSYEAFARAMRHGIGRDGRHLYPAFPYTSFAKMSDADMQSLYAYLMSQPAVKSVPPQTKLAFPYNVRALMAGWNTLFHRASPFEPDPAQSVEWNRGAYLVQGVGHCSACHSSRNALGAERQGELAYLGGGEAEGWQAPALNALSHAPRPWTENDLFDYLRTGFSANHGVAAGPMAPVVHGLAELPDSDVRAMAVYLASLDGSAAFADEGAQHESAPEPDRTQALRMLPGSGASVFRGACAACHETTGGPVLFGVKPPLELNTNLHADQPDNVIQVILHGIQDPAHDSLGYMPGFASSLSDGQIADVVEYLRARYAGGKPAWQNVKARVSALRAAAAQHEAVSQAVLP